MFLPPQLGNGSRMGTGVFGVAVLPPRVPTAGLLVALRPLLKASFLGGRLSAITCLGFQPRFFGTVGAGVGRVLSSSTTFGEMPMLTLEAFV